MRAQPLPETFVLPPDGTSALLTPASTARAAAPKHGTASPAARERPDGQRATPPRPSLSERLRREAAWWIDQGFVVLPLIRNEKRPIEGWKDYASGKKNAPDLARVMRHGEQTTGLWVLVRNPWVVVDLDNQDGERYWRDRLGPAFNKAAKVQTGKGSHLWFRAPAGFQGQQWKQADRFDIRVASKGGVVVPGSVHQSGHEYAWHDQPAAMNALPVLTEVEARLLNPDPQPRKQPAAGDTAKRAKVTNRALRILAEEVEAVTDAPEGGRNDQLNRSALNLFQLVEGGSLTRRQVRDELTRAAAASGLDEHGTRRTIASAQDKAKERPRVVSDNEDQINFDDARLTQWVADNGIGARFCWSGGLRWMQYRDGIWREATDATITEAIRQMFIDLHQREARSGAEVDYLKRLSGLLNKSKIGAVVQLLRGVLEVNAADFDNQPDLLAVGNGVVDLRTGQLQPDDPALRLTKRTRVEYHPGATSADWPKALQALPADVADWLQVRFGQAITGHMTSDDVMLVLQGNGSNGKSTVVEAIRSALGDHAVAVPERVLLASPTDHPTELTTLMGARVAIIEEAPEGRRLSVKRLKDTLGTPTMTARKVHKDNVTWQASHSLFLTSNYRPRINETDHGSWRRLALLRFPYTFRKAGEEARSEWDREGDPLLRERLRAGEQGQHQAVLAWLVDGARRWYEAGKVLPGHPASVSDDTQQWRAGSDLVLAYVTERLTFEGTSKTLAAELHADFNKWLEERGQEAWGDQLFTDRFGGHDEVTSHDVSKGRTRSLSGLSRPSRPLVASPGGQATVWRGVRFQDDPSQPTLLGGAE